MNVQQQAGVVDTLTRADHTLEPERFVHGPIEGVIFTPLQRHEDARGWLVELYREDELPPKHKPVMAYLSQTQPGVARGPHEHAQQTDHFVFLGPGDFTLYVWDIRSDSPTWGHSMTILLGESNQQTVIVPPGVVHAYKNTSPKPGCVLNFPNRLYAGKGKQEPVDEIRHENRQDSPYRLD